MKVNKVFLALRTDFFGDMVEDEHITLKYFHEVDFNYLVKYAGAMDSLIPTEIRLNGFANWTADSMFYEVALVDSWLNPTLWTGVRTPHITIRKSNKPLSNATFVPEVYGVKVDLIDRLWLGKKVKGKIMWMPFNTNDIHLNIKDNWNELVRS